MSSSRARSVDALDSTERPTLSLGEFVAMMAWTIALTALAIDSVLPAMQTIARDLGAVGDNSAQYIVTVMFAGFCFGQVAFGALSDATGRKQSLYLGITIFGLGCGLSLWARSYAVMLVGRGLQGLGASSLRVVTTAVVRDQFAGRAMARVMALVMAVFILVPAVAPAMGQAMMTWFQWRAIFVMLVVHALLALVWFGVRQPETLAKDARRALRWTVIWQGVRMVIGSRIALGYMLASGLVFASMIGYLTTAQQLFQGVYGVGRLFPVYFGLLALAIGVASVVNSRLVERLGMVRLSYVSLWTICVASACFAAFAFSVVGHPPLSVFVLYMLVVFASLGLNFGNFTALAMEPLGHVAGLGAAVVGAGSSLVSLVLGGVIGQAFDGTVRPLALGFLTLGLAALALVAWTERGRAPG